MLFWLGTHQPSWLAITEIPLFISAVRLRGRKSFPRAKGSWALDSGGFSGLSKHGRWRIPPRQYVGEVQSWQKAIGNLAWAAAQDWMCEPIILAKTGLNIQEHQRNTVENYLELRALAPDIPWVPVLQGWHSADYLSCADLYTRRGVDLAGLPLVGVGSVCRRQATDEAEVILRDLAGMGFKLHGFGFKLRGLRNVWQSLTSADSMAWSFRARHRPPLLGHEARHRTCANCLDFALMWRNDALRCIGVKKPVQLRLFA